MSDEENSNNNLRERRLRNLASVRAYRLRNPERYAYNNLRDSARRRGIRFEISFEYFLRFAGRTDYIARKGIHKLSWHVDRIRDERGYIEGNLQLLQNADNAAKEIVYRRWFKLRSMLAEAGFPVLLPDYIAPEFSYRQSVQYDEFSKSLYMNVSKENPPPDCPF